MEPIRLKQKDIKPLREKMLKDQNYICPLCNRTINIDRCALDHAHCRQGGDGCVRMVLCFFCNTLLSKIENNYKRNLVPYDILNTFLVNTFPYLDKKYTNLIHPTESKSKKKKLGKRKFNKVIKHWKKIHPKAKKPIYPKSGNMTKQWEIWIKETEDLK